LLAQTILVENQFIGEAAQLCRYVKGYIDVRFWHFRFMALVVARKTFIHPSKQMRILHEKLFQICSAFPHVQPHMNRLYTTGSAPTPDKSRYRTCAVPGLQVYDYVAYERI
jgi:hypothetical protein